ncbi:hypothetical protein GOBAR_AA32828 [Gossypium barbadense]|uniref:Uncharacterized protein n=1 Tax=Gossypium barbadense TaxID=3634 RepID=A0A2P5WA09_GOSBA|nr:hypothetical protein GOBAR_AA32828 [Gossypium barbadense]
MYRKYSGANIQAAVLTRHFTPTRRKRGQASKCLFESANHNFTPCVIYHVQAQIRRQFRQCIKASGITRYRWSGKTQMTTGQNGRYNRLLTISEGYRVTGEPRRHVPPGLNGFELYLISKV